MIAIKFLSGGGGSFLFEAKGRPSGLRSPTLQMLLNVLKRPGEEGLRCGPSPFTDFICFTTS